MKSRPEPEDMARVLIDKAVAVSLQFGLGCISQAKTALLEEGIPWTQEHDAMVLQAMHREINQTQFELEG